MHVPSLNVNDSLLHVILSNFVIIMIYLFRLLTFNYKVLLFSSFEITFGDVNRLSGLLNNANFRKKSESSCDKI